MAVPDPAKLRRISTPVDRALAAHEALDDLDQLRSELEVIRGDALVAAADSGATSPQLGSMLGVSGARVRQIITAAKARQGVPVAPSRRELARQTLTSSLLRRLYVTDGLSINAIARDTGFDSATIRRYLDVHGIPVRPRTEGR